MDAVVHFEIPAKDLKRAEKFYSEIFGWKIKDWSTPEMKYLGAHTTDSDENGMPKNPGAINGGIKPKESPDEGVVIALMVASVDETVKKVEAAGGKVVMPKTSMMGMGFYAKVEDTEGNVIGLWENAEK